MKKTILLLLLLPTMASQMLSAKETTRVVVRLKIKCTISQPGMFAEYAERYLGVKDAVKTQSTEYTLKEMTLFEQATAPEAEKHKLDTAIHFNLSCLGEEALAATSIPKMAERAAKQIYQLREARTALITGDMNVLPDGQALKTMLKHIEREERELVSLFIGKKATYTFYKDIIITPDKDLDNEVIARFSRLEGIVDADDYVGEPIYMTLKGKRVKAPELTPRQQKKVYAYEYVKGNAEIMVMFGDMMTEKLYLDEVRQFGADIPLID